MDDATTELAALVALLRRAVGGWTEITQEVQEDGSAARVLARQAGHADTLFPDETAATALIEAAAESIRVWRASGIDVHAFFEMSYPTQLRAIREMPPILFTRGVREADSHAVAVVGSRSASEAGLRIARSVASSLAGRGVTVVSGLAKGIDTAAHEAALEAGGRTVAVIGTGIERHYPATNRLLQEHIAEIGLVISQFWPDAAPAKHQFPMRNAVMSGYAAATVVVEAGPASGARIQARLALQHGRPVLLTSQVMEQEWAQTFAQRPGVHVVRSTSDLRTVVDDILGRLPTETSLEDFPDLATR
jgi:DNA processing protein